MAAGRCDDVERLCREHPDLAAELRTLQDAWSAGAVPGPTGAEASEGSVVDRYVWREPIAQGGMGRIWRVWDPDLRRDVALKELRADGDRLHPEQRARRRRRFLEEAHVLGQLQHPGIVPVYELGVAADGTPFFTMPLIRGRDLGAVFALVQEGRWPLERAVAALLRVAEALAKAHERGVIHRDLKPDNVMVGEHGEIYVLDWGLARASDRAERGEPGLAPRGEEATPLLTLEGDVVGTPAYMAPEQAAGRTAEIGPRSDVYAMGAMLYHLLSGSPPYLAGRDAASSRAVLDAVLDGPPPPLGDRVRRTWPALAAICEVAMARDREHRYADGAALVEDLQAVLEHRVPRALRATPWQRLRLFVQRQPALATTVVVASLLLLAAGVAFVLRERVLAARGQETRDYMAAQALRVQEGTTYPIAPATVPAMERWLQRVDELLARRPHYRELAAGSRRNLDAAELAQLLDNLSYLARLRPRVAGNLECARDLEQRSLREPAVAWHAARRAIRAAERYRGLDLPPQLGLVPLGANAQGCWEFWHVASGARPGTSYRPGDGIVLVLVPPGSAEQRLVPAFFLSKYEVTQGQWLRLHFTNPSHLPAGHGNATELCPVETVDWFEATRFARWLGLRLPQELEWEYACRAGAAAVADPARDNLLDGGTWGDGHKLVAPVGSLLPNGFGLHDMVGNVQEWTSQLWQPNGTAPLGAGAPLDEHAERANAYRAIRGASAYQPVDFAWTRTGTRPRHRDHGLGLRVARSIDGGE